MDSDAGFRRGGRLFAGARIHNCGIANVFMASAFSGCYSSSGRYQLLRFSFPCHPADRSWGRINITMTNTSQTVTNRAESVQLLQQSYGLRGWLTVALTQTLQVEVAIKYPSRTFNKNPYGCEASLTKQH